MEYKRTTWKSREVEHQNRFTMKDNGDGTVTLTPAPGKVIETGTPASADNFNNMESGIGIAIELAEKSNFKLESIDIYIDIDRGSDITGTGSASKPFKTFNGAKSLLESKLMWDVIQLNFKESNNIHEEVDWQGINSLEFNIKSTSLSSTKIKRISIANKIPGVFIRLQNITAGSFYAANLSAAQIYMVNNNIDGKLDNLGRVTISRASRIDVLNLTITPYNEYVSALDISETGTGNISNLIINSNSVGISTVSISNSLLKIASLTFNQKITLSREGSAINVSGGLLTLGTFDGDLKGANKATANGSIVIIGKDNTTNGKTEIKTNGGQVFKSS